MVSGKFMLWWKEKRLSEEEIKTQEIEMLKRLMVKYPEEIKKGLHG